MPCTVAQILKAEQVDDKFILDGINLHQVGQLNCTLICGGLKLWERCNLDRETVAQLFEV